ncbi:MAG: Zn-ribbon domain-containing OB-fold protein [Planctomycetes bacterium]|nr:Zn-ribbon domain-containing OB-fold protein [Planctomycetota bacterium]
MVEPKSCLEGEVVVPYRWSFGRSLGRFFEGLARRKIYGARCLSCKKVLVPPTNLCGACFSGTEDEWIEIGPAGVVTAATTVYLSFPGQPREPPYTWVTLALDGADSGFFHVIEEADPSEVKVGMRVEPVWNPAPKGDINDILYYRPVRGSP